MRNTLNRRHFLECTGACTAGAMLAGAAAGRTFAGPAPEGPRLPPARIYKLYAGRTGEEYLTRPTEELNRLEAYLADLETRLGDVKFVGGDMIPPAGVEEVAAKLKDEADALLIVHLSFHGGDAPMLGQLIDVGKPTAVFTQPFSGHGWMYFPQWRKQGKKVILLPTSDWSELDRTAGLMRAAAWMRQSRVLVVGAPHGTVAACAAEKVKEKLGAELVIIPNERVIAAMEAVDPAAAEAEAEAYWIKPATRVVEPTRDDVIQSARMAMGIKNLLIEEKAQAICSQHCMGTPRGCLAFSKLNDEGCVGGCEGDVDSTLTMLLFAYAFRVPGFISDPVVDTAKNALVHFHCTSATKMDGPGGARLPFALRNQTDTKGGVAVEVENRVGQPVTCAKLVNLDTILYTPGKIIETSRSPLACRTQFAQSVPDARRLFLDWGGGAVEGDMMTMLHRVVFYGDHTRALQDLGDLMGLKIVEEGGAPRTA